jgi:hypothetical protein
MAKQQESPFHTDWVEAITTFTGDVPSPGTFVKRGTRYPVDNVVVQAYPTAFVDDHLTADEKGRIYNERFYREPAAYEPTAFLPEPPKPENTVVAIRSKVEYVQDGRGAEFGESDHPVRLNPTTRIG